MSWETILLEQGIDQLAVLENDIIGATKTINLNPDGSVASIVYTVGGTTVRTDTFTYTAYTITEVRTAGSLTITKVHHLDTLGTEVS
jgi:hypothetical protein